MLTPGEAVADRVTTCNVTTGNAVIGKETKGNVTLGDVIAGFAFGPGTMLVATTGLGVALALTATGGNTTIGGRKVLGAAVTEGRGESVEALIELARGEPATSAGGAS